MDAWCTANLDETIDRSVAQQRVDETKEKVVLSSGHRSGYTGEREITKRSARAGRIEIDSRSIVATTRELRLAKNEQTDREWEFIVRA